MGWVAEILRKEHRVCAECRMGPTHVYDPRPAAVGADDPGLAQQGVPLCNSCLAARLAIDLGASPGRVLIFEPALGPDALVFRAIGDDSSGLSREDVAAARAGIDTMASRCDHCGADGRFRWVPVERDANLWPEDWLPALAAGGLSCGPTLCGACAAGEIMRAIEDRGLYFEAIVPPRAGDGVIFGGEA